MPSSDQRGKDEAVGERRSQRMRRAFPGGQVRLPRLRRPAGVPDEDLARDEPLRRDPAERAPSKDRGFEAYYSHDSLFEKPVDDIVEQTEGPYAVLGLTRTATWEQVSKAHRRLVAQLHPDRYVGEDDLVQEAAERRVRDVNEAFATIRRQRAVQRA